jgi:hypothetical protein
MQNLLFGMPAAYTLTSWGNIAWGSGFIGFDSILGSHFEKNVGALDINTFFCFMLVSRLLFLLIFVSESGRLALPKQAFGVRGVAKTNFTQKLEFC